MFAYQAVDLSIHLIMLSAEGLPLSCKFIPAPEKKNFIAAIAIGIDKCVRIKSLL